MALQSATSLGTSLVKPRKGSSSTVTCEAPAAAGRGTRLAPQEAPFRLFPTILCLSGTRAEENQFWLAGLMLFKIFKAGLFETVQKSLLDFYLPLVCHSVLVLRLGKQIRSYVFVLKTVDI